MRMKGQAALEFLMTYGWAILIVIAVVAALYAMGVFKLPTGGLGKCSPCFPAGAAVAYVDHSAGKLVVTVGPNAIDNTRVYVYNSKTGDFIDFAYNETVGPFNPGTTITYSNPDKPSLFSGDVNIYIEYQDVVSKLFHNVTATLHGA
jgi:uncharacterized protein (UPF0333 family)